MHIFVITKRQCVGRDFLDDRFWRLYEIPEHLCEFGHTVAGLTLSYRSRIEGVFRATSPMRTTWSSLNAGPLPPYKLWLYLRHLRRALLEFKPDVVWASSDVWHAIAAWRVCPPLRIPFVIDLYDNYESFGLTKLPGLTNLLRAACRNTSGLTLISRTLGDYVDAHYGLPTGLPRLVLGNAVDVDRFSPMPKQTARAALGLPQDTLLVGTAGAIQANRGINTLIHAFIQLAEFMPNLRLLLAGPKDDTLDHLTHPRITYLGVLPPEKVPLFWNALDVAVVQNRDTDFGRYCYPQKLQEIVACEVPLVASRVGEVAELLRDTPACLADPDSPAALAERIDVQIRKKIRVDRKQVRSWAQRAEELSEFFETVIARSDKGGQRVGDSGTGRGGA